MITPGQNKRLHQLLTEKGLDADAKADIIKHFTRGRTTSSKELTFREAQWIIDHLLSLQSAPIAKTEANNAISLRDAADKMRKKIISLFREMGFTKYSEERRNNVADMQRIYSYILQSGYLKKPLNDYTNDELPKLVTQVESIHKKHLESLKR